MISFLLDNSLKMKMVATDSNLNSKRLFASVFQMMPTKMMMMVSSAKGKMRKMTKNMEVDTPFSVLLIKSTNYVEESSVSKSCRLLVLSGLEELVEES
jgi:phosphoenolpyruvate synthase/pyruvate phosphate dikinase